MQSHVEAQKLYVLQFLDGCTLEKKKNYMKILFIKPQSGKLIKSCLAALVCFAKYTSRPNKNNLLQAVLNFTHIYKISLDFASSLFLL